MQLLDVLICNSANKQPFLNLTKSHVAQCSFDGKSAGNVTAHFPSKECWAKRPFSGF